MTKFHFNSLLVSQPLQWAARAAYQNAVSLEDTDEFTFEDASDDSKNDHNSPITAGKFTKKEDSGNFFTHSPQGKGFIDFLASSQFADVTLVLRDTSEFLAHQLILAYSSGYFYELFVGSRNETKLRARVREIVKRDSKKSREHRREKHRRSKLAKIEGDDAGSADEDDIIVTKAPENVDIDEGKKKVKEMKSEKKNAQQEAKSGSEIVKTLKCEIANAMPSVPKLAGVDASIANSETDESSEFSLSLSSSFVPNDSLALTTSTEPFLRNDVMRIVHLEFEHSASEFRAVLEYMYRGSVEVTAKNCVSLMAVARQYRIVPLQKLVRDFFR